MQEPEYVQENEMHKILRDFLIQTNYQTQARRSNQVLIN